MLHELQLLRGGDGDIVASHPAFHRAQVDITKALVARILGNRGSGIGQDGKLVLQCTRSWYHFKLYFNLTVG